MFYSYVFIYRNDSVTLYFVLCVCLRENGGKWLLNLTFVGSYRLVVE